MSSVEERPKAVLVGLQLPKVGDVDMQASLQELRRLVDTLGFEVVGFLTQKRGSTQAAMVLGQGKLKELAKWTGGTGEVKPTFEAKKHKAARRFKDNDDGVEDDDSSDEAGEPIVDELSEDIPEDQPGLGPPAGVKASVVIFDCDLSPSQLRNLESATGAQVLDRTGVIIEIFSRHARTRAAKLQVEIARLNYMAPRLRETGGGEDRQGGGVGGKGAGETSLELDRRRIRDRLKELRDELATIQRDHDVRRNRRADENCVALVGYTNAGKSSLMRALTHSEILVADKLFATLDTTVRPIEPPTVPRVLVSDTVGFIKKLPHDLVASFKSTLDEALNADLLLYMVDASDPTYESQLQVTREVLGEIGAAERPSLIIFNKRDRVSHADLHEIQKKFPGAVFISTRDPLDIERMREKILEHFEGHMVDVELVVPYATQGAIGDIRREMRVLEESFTADGVRVLVRARQTAIDRLKSRYQL